MERGERNRTDKTYRAYRTYRRLGWWEWILRCAQDDLGVEFRFDKRRMLAHQVAFWELPNFVKLLVGGMGSGQKKVLSAE